MTAYHSTHSQAVLQHALRRLQQSHVASRVGLTLLWLMVFGLATLGAWQAPPQHLPWTKLAMSDPVGLFTHGKIAHADGQLCRTIMAQGGVSYVNAPEETSGAFCSHHDAVRLDGGTAPLAPAAVMTCGEALAYALWERQVVQMAAYQHLGSGVVAVDHYGAYSCRRMYGDAALPVSEHASANALDIAGFTLADGRHISVARDWNDAGENGQFLHAVRDGACDVFAVTLSPDFNAEHADHLHLDMGKGKVCH
jgi:hypothetical protein